MTPTNNAPGGGFDEMMTYPASGPVFAGNECLLYYSGFSVPHNAPASRHDGKIGLARLRPGGICSLDATSEGSIVTKPFLVPGGRLEVNLQAKGGAPGACGEEQAPWLHAFAGAPGGAGSLLAEVQRPDGTPAEGYEAAACIPAAGDGLALPVRWRGRKDVEPLRGGHARLKFVLRNAKLYGWRLCGEGGAAG